LNQELTKQKHQEVAKTSQVIKKQDLISYFSREEILSLISGLPSGKDRVMIQTMWATGCRVSEINQLRKSDLDFHNDTITVSWLKSRKKLRRNIPLHKQLKEILYIYTASMAYDERLFPVTRQRIYQICQNYGFDHPHKLRHSFAINFIRQANNPHSLITLKRIMGHARIDTTMQYLEIVPADQAGIYNQIELLNP
jgi:integrase